MTDEHRDAEVTEVDTLTGKVAVVTGAASGIGRASAIALASEGAAIACVDRNEGGAAETVAAITAAGGAARAYTADIADADAVAAFLTATLVTLAASTSPSTTRASRVTRRRRPSAPTPTGHVPSPSISPAPGSACAVRSRG